MGSTYPAKFGSDRVLNHLPDPIILTDRRGNITWVNQKTEEIFGISGEEIKGWAFIQIIKLDKIDKQLREVLHTGECADTAFEAATIKVRNPEGKYFFKISIKPFLNNGEVEGAMIQLSDVSRFKELEKIKTDFISIVSHELRTPLSSMSMAVGMLKDGLLGQLTPRGKEMVDAIERDCDRLNKLAENLLDLSKIEAGQIALETQLIRVQGLVDEAVRPMQLQAEAKGVELVTDIPSDLPVVEVDFNKIVWVLANLVANALRYTESGDKVTVEVYTSENRMFFHVHDTGCGIPEEYQEKIFQKFVQVRGEGGPVGGAGLGLAICKEFVEAHNGQIWVESEEGRGSTFTFTLPLARSEKLSSQEPQ